MTLFKVKTAPVVLIEDDYDKNIIPLVQELCQYEKGVVNMFCYEQPICFWKNVLKSKHNVQFYEAIDINEIKTYAEQKCIIMIDSLNQLTLNVGLINTIKIIKSLAINPNIAQLILVLHSDCLPHASKLKLYFNHIASAIISYDVVDNSKISVNLKKSGKLIKTTELLSYNIELKQLTSTPILQETKKEEEPSKPLPSNLTTFKIEMEESEKLERSKLKLPYMNKINEGQSKVFYEPDAVDDWDEEDPDDDLDI